MLQLNLPISVCGMYQHLISSSIAIYIPPFSNPNLRHLPKMLPLVVSVGTRVGKTHLDYIAHEVPLPLFGFGHDWACTFHGAPLPLLGQA